MIRKHSLYSFICLVALLVMTSSAVAEEGEVRFDIESQELGTALSEFALQSGKEILFVEAQVSGKSAPSVSGDYEPTEALELLLADTSLDYKVSALDTILVSEGGASDSKNLTPTPVLMAQNQQSQSMSSRNEDDNETKSNRSAEDDDRSARGQIETIVVRGSRNAGIRRYKDDVQPYVIFDGPELETAFASNIEDFLKTRLPMNATQFTNAQSTTSAAGNASTINLRGLGTNQTLILVNGRRQPGVSIAGVSNIDQPDINGIPMSAVERIEVLPTTAAGIYGGGATGGAINIILKRDFAGIDLSAGYDNSTRGDAERFRLSGSAGWSLEQGKTNIRFDASFTSSQELRVDDRPFAMRSRSLLTTNNPDVFLTGTPILAYTANIQSVDGTDLVLDTGQELGSPITFVPEGYSGTTGDGGAALIANAGQYNINVSDQESNRSLVLTPEVKFFALGLRRQFSERVEIFLDSNYSSNKSSGYGAGFAWGAEIEPDAPTNPFTTAIRVSYPTPGVRRKNSFSSERSNLVGGVNLDLWGEWSAGLEYSWNQSKTKSSSYSPAALVGYPLGVASGELDVLRDLNEFPLDLSQYLFTEPTEVSGPSELEQENIALRASGPILKAAGGDVVLSTLLERRIERALPAFRDNTSAFTGESTTSYFPGRERDVESAYAELLAPIISSKNSLSFMTLLELQLAVRHDRYRTTSARDFPQIVLQSRSATVPDIEFVDTNLDSTDYTAGLRFSPVDDLVIRGSIGTGFLPPSLLDLQSFRFNFPLTLVDPKRGGVPLMTSGPVDWELLGNTNLRPEESESRSLGIIITPRAVDGLRLSADYTLIEKSEEIASVLNLGNIFDFEDIFPSRVMRLPLTPEDEALGYTGGEVIGLDTSPLNISKSRVEAWDFQVNYQFDLEHAGSFEIYAVATRQTEFERRILPGSPSVDSVGFDDGPLRWRGNLGLNWQLGAWKLGWNAQHFDSYRSYSSTDSDTAIAIATQNQGSSRIPSQTYHDVFLQYAPRDQASGILSNLKVNLGIQNVFDRDPPTVAVFGLSQGFFDLGGYSYYGDPRLRRFSLEVTKSF